MNKTQLEWTKQMLRENGRVTRNQALANHFSRLGARIQDLKNAGWEIDGKPLKYKDAYGKQRKDYVYTLVAEPGVPLTLFGPMRELAREI